MIPPMVALAVVGVLLILALILEVGLSAREERTPRYACSCCRAIFPTFDMLARHETERHGGAGHG